MPNRSILLAAPLAAALIPGVLAACTSTTEEPDAGAADAGRGDALALDGSTSTPDAAEGGRPEGGGTSLVNLHFAGRVGAQPFACGQTYDGVGTTSARVQAADFRFFVHDLRLLRPDGTEVPVALEAKEPWQNTQVALLDFEDKTGPCEFGTSGTNTQVAIRAAEGPWDGIAFTVGMPEVLNHVNVELASSPLASSKMQWSWTAGFIHFASQLNSEAMTTTDAGLVAAPPFYAHIGSTQCSGDPEDGGVAACARSNRPSVKLRGFDPVRHVVVADLKKAYASSNVDVNGGGMSGCMSGTTDPECEPLFGHFGIDFATGGAKAGAEQDVFSVEPMSGHD